MNFWKVIFTHMGEEKTLITEFETHPTTDQIYKFLIDSLYLNQVGDQTLSEIIEGNAIVGLCIEEQTTTKPVELT